MKTEELIDLLSMNVEPVDHGLVARNLGVAVAVGALASLVAMLLALGVRTDLNEAGALTFLLAKLAFSLGVIGVAYVYLTKLARPGGERNAKLTVVVLPFVAITLFAVLSLAFAPRAHWEDMIVGDMWLQCLVSIPVIAIVPFAIVVWTVRWVASPTDLVRTGALIGLAAGGVSAMGYALHCTSDTLPFIALWYGGTIALCILVGAILGPRLLRW